MQSNKKICKIFQCPACEKYSSVPEQVLMTTCSNCVEIIDFSTIEYIEIPCQQASLVMKKCKQDAKFAYELFTSESKMANEQIRVLHEKYVNIAHKIGSIKGKTKKIQYIINELKTDLMKETSTRCIELDQFVLILIDSGLAFEDIKKLTKKLFLAGYLFFSLPWKACFT